MKYFFCAIFFFCLASNVLGRKRNSNQVIVLTDDNWKQCLEGQWMIKFYAPWCPACKANEAPYAEFAEWSEDLGINVAMVDITKEAGLSGRFMVTALPTFYYGRGGEFRRYNADRKADSMHEYVDNQHWMDAEPIWWVRHPNSVLMTLMSWLFKASVLMKGIHDSLTEEYGLSTWMSYALFGAGTVATGLLLGLVLVCVVDIVAPAQSTKPKKPQDKPVGGDGEVSEKERKEKRARETEEESAASTDDEEERKSQDSTPASQSSSQASQEWETIHDLEVADAEQATGGAEVRQRKKVGAEEEKEEQKEKVGEEQKEEGTESPKDE